LLKWSRLQKTHTVQLLIKWELLLMLLLLQKHFTEFIHKYCSPYLVRLSVNPDAVEDVDFLFALIGTVGGPFPDGCAAADDVDDEATDASDETDALRRDANAAIALEDRERKSVAGFLTLVASPDGEAAAGAASPLSSPIFTPPPTSPH
jgi:hypothetical protein